MPFDDEGLPCFEPDPELDALARSVIGAAIEVHTELGAGTQTRLLLNFNTIRLRDGIKRVIRST